MPTELIYVALDHVRLARLLEASEALNLTVEEIVQEAVSEFLDEKRRKR